MIFINILLVILLVFIIIKLITLKKENNDIKNIIQEIEKEKQLNKLINNLKFLKNTDEFLKNNSYPFKLNVLTYWGIKLSCLVLMTIVFMDKNNIFIGLILGIIMFFALDIIIFFKRKENEEKICSDMVNVYETLIIQVNASMPLTKILTELYRVAQFEIVKRPLKIMSLIIIRKKDVDLALTEFEKYFPKDNIHIQNFCIAFKQAFQTGKSNIIFRDMLGNIREINKNYEKKIPLKIKRKLDTLSVMIYGTIIILISFVMIYKVIVEMNSF